MEKCVLAVDLGASSGRLIAGCLKNGQLHCTEIHRFINEPVRCAGSLYWDVLRLLTEIKTGIAKAAQSYEILSLSVDTWGVDFGLLDATGRLLSNPVCYRDERTRGILNELSSQLSLHELYQETGNTPDEINTLMQLAAMRRQQPELLKQAHRLLFMPDLIGYFLTGRQRCEFTIASTSQCLNPERTAFHHQLLERLNLPSGLFAPLAYPGERLGRLSAAVAEECGCAQFDVVLCGSHDTASAVFALPAAEAHPQFLSCGTWAITGQVLDHPVITEKSEALGFSNEGSHGGKTRLVRNLTGLWIIQQCRAELQRMGRKLSYDQIEALMEGAQDFDSLIDTQAPVFREFGGMVERIHQFLRQTGQKQPSDDGELFWCVYQSLAAQMKLAYDELDQVSGLSSKQLYMVGGGCQSQTLRQKIADACGREIVAGPVEATALGNIAVQLISAGLIQDKAEMTQLILNSETIRTACPKTSMEDKIEHLLHLKKGEQIIWN